MNLNLIPQIFYDFIARLLPGSVIIWSTYMIYYGPTIFIKHIRLFMKNELELNLFLISFLLILSYILSILLISIWNLVQYFIKSKLIEGTFIKNKEFKRIIIEDYIKDVFSSLEIKQDQKLVVPEASFIYDFIRKTAPDVGARIVKIRAEIHMCSVLVIGWTILFFGNLFINKFIFLYSSEIILFFCIVLIWLYKMDLENRLSIALSNYWIIFHSDYFKKGTAPNRRIKNNENEL